MVLLVFGRKAPEAVPVADNTPLDVQRESVHAIANAHDVYQLLELKVMLVTASAKRLPAEPS